MNSEFTPVYEDDSGIGVLLEVIGSRTPTGIPDRHHRPILVGGRPV